MKKDEIYLIFLGLFGLFGILVSISIDDIWSQTYSILIFLISASILILWFVLLLEMAFEEHIKYTSVRIFGTLLFSSLLFYASILSTQNINNIFSVDSSVFPYTHIIFTVTEFLVLLTPFFVVLFLLSFLLLFSLGASFRITKNQNKVLVIMVSIIGFIISIVYIGISLIFMDEKNKTSIIYSIAHVVDFKKKNICTNIDEEKYSIVYLGTNHKNVLMDNIYIRDRNTSKTPIPTNFKVLDCDM